LLTEEQGDVIAPHVWRADLIMKIGRDGLDEEEPLNSGGSRGSVGLIYGLEADSQEETLTLPQPSSEDRLSVDSSTPQLPDADVPEHLPPTRSLTFLDGLALAIGIRIGSGIFSSPSAVINGVRSPGLVMLIWFLAGVLAWGGAASFIELGSIVPLNGGVQEYLRYVYHDILGSLLAVEWRPLLRQDGDFEPSIQQEPRGGKNNHHLR
jgi:hypothetical protein